MAPSTFIMKGINHGKGDFFFPTWDLRKLLMMEEYCLFKNSCSFITCGITEYCDLSPMRDISAITQPRELKKTSEEQSRGRRQ